MEIISITIIALIFVFIIFIKNLMQLRKIKEKLPDCKTHDFSKWKLSAGGCFQRKTCKNCNYTIERIVEDK